VAGFRTSLTDLILWQADSAGVWRPANVDRATTTGAEIELETRTRHAGVRPNLAYLVARSNGRDLPYRPHLTVSVEHWLSWRWVRLGWNVRYTGSRFADAANSDTLPAYLLFDVGLDLSQRIGPVTADLRGGVRNLFDRRYQAVRDYPTPGRSFYSELELRI
jgi:outer membrane cobalamin receptor